MGKRRSKLNLLKKPSLVSALQSGVGGAASIDIRFVVKLGKACRFHSQNKNWACSQAKMAERQQRQRLRALRNDRNLARFVVEGRATGKQLGTGSYGSVEEVFNKPIAKCSSSYLIN